MVGDLHSLEGPQFLTSFLGVARGERTEPTLLLGSHHLLHLSRQQQGQRMLQQPLVTVGTSGGEVVQRLPWASAVPQPSWPERFQDLASWCPPPRDELNTPQTTQDEFNFRIDGQGRDFNTWDDIASPGGVGGGGGVGVSQCDDGGMNKSWDSDLLYLTTMSPEPGGGEGFSREVKRLGGGGEIDEEGSDVEIIKSGAKNLLLSQGVLQDGMVKRNNFAFFKRDEPKLVTADNYFGGYNSSLNVASPPDASLAQSAPTSVVKQERTMYDEEDDLFKVPQLNRDSSSEIVIPHAKKERPKLRLNIVAANITPSSQAVVSVDTPDVMRSLTDDSTSFDLLSFVNGDFDDPNVLTTEPEGGMVVTQGLEAFKTDHDYTGSNCSSILSNSSKFMGEFKTEVKEEREDEEEEDEKVFVEKVDVGRKRKRKRSLKEEEFEEEEEEEELIDERYKGDDDIDCGSDDEEKGGGGGGYDYEDEEDDDDDDDDSVDWSPYKKKKRVGSVGGGMGSRGGKKRGGGRRGKRDSQLFPSSSAMSPIDGSNGIGSLVVAAADKYRELRDRNNEASRKSRLNRKQKEMEMVRLAEHLEKDNIRLKKKADTLEKLVKKSREALMNIILKKN